MLRSEEKNLVAAKKGERERERELQSESFVAPPAKNLRGFFAGSYVAAFAEVEE